MDLTCSNCKHYNREYYTDNGQVKRYPSGLCERTVNRLRKMPGQSCKCFLLRETEREEELIIRRQKLLAEIEELTNVLRKVKMLADIAKRIQEEFGGKEID